METIIKVFKILQMLTLVYDCKYCYVSLEIMISEYLISKNLKLKICIKTSLLHTTSLAIFWESLILLTQLSHLPRLPSLYYRLPYVYRRP